MADEQARLVRTQMQRQGTELRAARRTAEELRQELDRLRSQAASTAAGGHAAGESAAAADMDPATDGVVPEVNGHGAARSRSPAAGGGHRSQSRSRSRSRSPKASGVARGAKTPSAAAAWMVRPPDTLAERLKRQVVDLRRQVVARDADVARLQRALHEKHAVHAQQAAQAYATEIARLRSLLQVRYRMRVVECPCCVALALFASVADTVVELDLRDSPQRSSEALSKENAARTELERALRSVEAQARHRTHEAMAARRTADATATELARCQDVVQQLACPVPQVNDEVDVVMPGGGNAGGASGGGGGDSGSDGEYSDDFDSDHGPAAAKSGSGRGRPMSRRGTVVARSASCHHITVSYMDGEVR